ncbi:hypothetical protein [Glycomyces sp. NPDC048151]|uniref:hypothetical protein n=1 Tax=Glycomyces sp. NPDC048151 TaxID=3364002 RepID=UPI00371E6812
MTDTGQASPSPVMSILLAIIGSGLLAALIGAIMTNLRANAETRRSRYAQAVKSLVSWAEYPYRIRRRVNDEPSTLTNLAETGHRLQEQLAESRAWVTAEHKVAGLIYVRCLHAVRSAAGPACSKAWRAGPADTPEKMVLGDIGVGSPETAIVVLERAITFRFGLRRLMAPIALRRILRALPDPAAAEPNSKNRGEGSAGVQ